MTNVLFYNEIGRQGKSVLAYNLYDFLKRQNQKSNYITNDITNISFNAKKLLGEDLHVIKPSEEIEIEEDEINIFDFGGFLDSRTLLVAEYVKYIVIPVSYSSNSELTLTAQVIKSLTKYNQNIIVVFNKTKPTKVRRGTEMLIQLLNILEVDVLKILTVAESEYMNRLADFNQSIFDVADASKSDNTRLNKTLLPQLTELFNLIRDENNG